MVGLTRLTLILSSCEAHLAISFRSRLSSSISAPGNRARAQQRFERLAGLGRLAGLHAGVGQGKTRLGLRRIQLDGDFVLLDRRRRTARNRPAPRPTGDGPRRRPRRSPVPGSPNGRRGVILAARAISANFFRDRASSESMRASRASASARPCLLGQEVHAGQGGGPLRVARLQPLAQGIQLGRLVVLLRLELQPGQQIERQRLRAAAVQTASSIAAASSSLPSSAAAGPARSSPTAAWAAASGPFAASCRGPRSLASRPR